MYRFIVLPLTFILRIYFRQLEIVGLHRVPSDGPVIFVLNHPNGLVDPVVIMCFAPRQITFLGKAPLFKMFFIGWVARAIEAIPVYRLQDERGLAGTQEKNQLTFQIARKHLSEGKSIAIFPEGVSHSDTKLKPLKSGAARIAIGSGLENLKIVPAGLFYTEKREFRSSALLYFGEPFSMPPFANVGTATEPDRQAVRALTDRIKEALDEVTLQAERPDALQLIERAERIFTAASRPLALPWSSPKLWHRFQLQRQFMAGYKNLKQQAPEKLAALETRIRVYEARLGQVGLELGSLPSQGSTASIRVFRGSLLAIIRLAALPLVALGFVGSFPIYRVVGLLSKKLAKDEDDLLSTIKVLSALALFPVWWVLLAVALGAWRGWTFAALLLPLLPVSAYVALIFLERIHSDLARLRAIWFAISHWSQFADLQREQGEIREEILSYREG
jgi:1-acyl-sn-glycerol-3-phosphate acyltransferase